MQQSIDIFVDYDLASIFREWVYVRRDKIHYCECSLNRMNYTQPVNIEPDNPNRVCVTCGGVVTPARQDLQNKYEGSKGNEDGI